MRGLFARSTLLAPCTFVRSSWRPLRQSRFDNFNAPPRVPLDSVWTGTPASGSLYSREQLCRVSFCGYARLRPRAGRAPKDPRNPVLRDSAG